VYGGGKRYSTNVGGAGALTGPVGQGNIEEPVEKREKEQTEGGSRSSKRWRKLPGRLRSQIKTAHANVIERGGFTHINKRVFRGRGRRREKSPGQKVGRLFGPEKKNVDVTIEQTRPGTQRSSWWKVVVC